MVELGFLTDRDLTRMLSVHFAMSEVDSPSSPSILSTRLREMASALLRLADAQEGSVPEIAAPALSEDRAHLRAELGRIRGDIETLLSSLVEASARRCRCDALA
jgi:hypothetical protein